MVKIVLASANQGKLREMQQLLAPLKLQLIPQHQFTREQAEENGVTFVENALLKARFAAAKSGLPALADDSGLEVDALDGAPGIHSARFAGVTASDEKNNQKLLAHLQQLPDAPRNARFRCVLAYLRHPLDPAPIIAQGVWEGEIIDTPRGTNGFGYDPLFYSPQHQLTSAELTPAVKNRTSHRARALQQLIALMTDATLL